MLKQRTENLINPIGIDVKAPRFSWCISSSKRGCFQKSYRVIVSKSADFSDDNIVWDSGIVNTEESINVIYNGTELEPLTRYYWKAEATDNYGEIHTDNPVYFETGFMEETAFSDTLWLTKGSYPSVLTKENSEYADRRYNATSFTIETEMQIINGFGGIVFGRTDSDNFKELRIVKNGNVCALNYIMGKCNYLTYEDFPAELTKESIAEKLNVKIIVEDGKCKISINGKECRGFSIEPFGVKKVGFSTSNGSITKYDFIKVMLGNGELYFEDNFADDKAEHYYSKLMMNEGKYISNRISEFAAPKDFFDIPDTFAAPMFRRGFKVADKCIVSARLYATAAGVYNAYINGKRVTDSYLNPGRTQYNKRLMYQTYAVTELLQTGDNAIGVILGHGWWDRANGDNGTRLGFTGKLIINYADGTSDIIMPDEKWLYYFDGPVRTDDIFDGQFNDNNKKIDNWCCADFEPDNLWTTPVLLPKSAFSIGKIVSQNIPYNTVLCEIPAISVKEPIKGVFVYDFGQNVAGICRIKVTGKKGTNVQMSFAEKLFVKGLAKECWQPDDYNVPGTIWTKNLINGSTVVKAKQTDNFILRGDAEGETFEADLIYHGFQYVQITGIEKAIDIVDVKAIVIMTELEKAGEFECSNELVNKYVSNTSWSQIDNFLSVPTDCPQRNERMGWAADAQVFTRTGAYLRDINAFLEKYQKDICDVQNDLGVFPDAAPGWAEQHCKGGWSDAGVIIPWQIYMQYGNKKILENSYPNIIKYIERNISECTDYIDNKHGTYGDWLSGEHTPHVICETAMVAYSCSLVSKIAQILDKAEDAEKYKAHFENFRKVYSREFMGEDFITKCDPVKYGNDAWGNKNESGIVDTQTSYVLGTYFQIFDDETCKKAAERLAYLVEKQDYHIKTGFLGVSYLLPVLTKYGYIKQAYKMITQTTYPSWLYAVKNGATSIYECWYGHTVRDDGTQTYTASHNHYCYGSATEWLFKAVAGIERDDNIAAFKHFILCPLINNTLEYAGGSYDSIYGKIRSRWEIGELSTVYEATVPANTTATLKLKNITKITENGMTNDEIEGVSSVKFADGELIAELTSGDYRFILN